MSVPYSYTPYIWPMLASAIISGALAVYAWRHRTVPDAAPFAVQEAFIALWALLTAMEMAATTPVKILHHKLEAAAAIAGMSAMLYFALEHARPGTWGTRRNALLLVLVTLGFAILIATNDLHHLAWTRMWYDQVVRFERGPLHPLLLAGALLLPALALLVFLRVLLRSEGIYRWQALLLFVGAALPVLTFTLEIAHINLLAPLDPVILMWNVSAALYALAIFRFHLLEVVPIGRDTAIDRMAHGVVVLDAEDRIVDFNPAAEEVLALSRRSAVGRPARQVLAAYPDMRQLLEQKTAASAEITLLKADKSRDFQVQASPLTHPRGFHLGRLILLRDVTEQRQAQAQILEQQRTLAALRERERLARELHDSLGQVFAFVNVQGQAVRLFLARGETTAADAHVARLIEAAREADADIRESILGLRVSVGEQGLFPALAAHLDQYEKHYGIHTELHWPRALGDGAFEPQVEVQLLRIIQEALANARKHARAGSASVTFTVQDGWAAVAVRDDGRGFDPKAVLGDAGGRVGLRVMRERAEEIGGTLTVQSAPGEGTHVEVRVPLRGGWHGDTGTRRCGDGETR